MKNFKVEIKVMFKDGILDPQAEAITSALKKLEFKSVQSLRCEKVFLVELSAENKDDAHRLGREMAQKLLANIVMENFEIEVHE